MDRLLRLNSKPLFQTGVPEPSLRPSQQRPASQPPRQCREGPAQCPKDSAPTVGAPSLPTSDPPSGQTPASAPPVLGPRRCSPALQTPPSVLPLEPGSALLRCGCSAPRAVWPGDYYIDSSYRLDVRDFNAFLRLIVMLSLY